MAAAPAHPIPVASLDVDARGTFLIRVYQHLAAAVLAFVAFETLLFSTGIAEAIYDLIAGNGAAWLLSWAGSWWSTGWPPRPPTTSPTPDGSTSASSRWPPARR